MPSRSLLLRAFLASALLPLLVACSGGGDIDFDDSKLGGTDAGDASSDAKSTDAAHLGLPDLALFDSISITDQPPLVANPTGCTNSQRVWSLKLAHPDFAESTSGRWILTHWGCKDGYHGYTDFPLRFDDLQAILTQIRALVRIPNSTSACVENPRTFLVQLSRPDHRLVPTDPERLRATAYVASPESFCKPLQVLPNSTLPEMVPFSEYGGWAVATGGSTLVSFLAARYYQTKTQD